MEPIDYRRAPGRPRRDEPPAPTERLRDRVPVSMMDLFRAILGVRKMSRQAAIREALADWIEKYRHLLG